MALRRHSTEDLIAGIVSGDRTILSRAITLIESTNTTHQEQARKILNACLPHAGNSLRIGVTGAPGVGKSTFIDALGTHLIDLSKRVAVLAVDPSSHKTGGSILGDKTRMAHLASHEAAFIRPSPNRDAHGGVAHRTREAILLCEAAGFDIVLIETVGVGQSEFSVHELVDVLVLLLITGAGDDLQGIKRGIMEMADLIVINKADGTNAPAARELKRTIRNTTHVLPAPRPEWKTRVLTASSVENQGIMEITSVLFEFEETMRRSSEFESNRGRQALAWMYNHIEEGLMRQLKDNKQVAALLSKLSAEVSAGKQNPVDAAIQVLKLFEK